MPEDDGTMAMTARTLADVLMRYARERIPDDKKAIAELHTELCRLRRAEMEAPPPLGSGGDEGR